MCSVVNVSLCVVFCACVYFACVYFVVDVLLCRLSCDEQCVSCDACLQIGEGLCMLSGSEKSSRSEGEGEGHSLKTAVHLASERGNLACLQLLLE